jgi:hypothetical protein
VSANWIGLYSKLGFDILTYKTVRKYKRLAHPWPNFFFLKDGKPLDPDVVQVAVEGEPADPRRALSAGSVGMPSTDPQFWRDDIRKSRARNGVGSRGTGRDGHIIDPYSLTLGWSSAARRSRQRAPAGAAVQLCALMPKVPIGASHPAATRAVASEDALRQWRSSLRPFHLAAAPSRVP